MLALGLLVLSACQPSYAQPAPEPTATEPAVAGLAGTRWLLASLGGDLPLPSTTVTLQFGADGTASGTDGCNQFSTSFVQDGSSLTILQPGASTLMACAADVMHQATAFMDALAATTSFSASERQLVLQNGSRILATFLADSQSLAGTSWEVTSYNNGRDAVVSLIVGSEINADFDAEGRVSGSAGCNSYFAGFTSGNGSITIDTPATTFKFCDEPPGVMEQEAEFLAALSSAATYSIQGNVLQMRRADDQLALMMTRRTVVDLPAPEPNEPNQPPIPWGRVTAAQGLNIRSGPGVNFPVIGVALYGDEGEIIGRSADSRWWATTVPSAPDGIGWVSVDFVIASNVENVRVIASPPPPVIPPTAVPPATPTPLPAPTATPAAQISLSADPTTINQGQCSTLRWSVQNVQAVWVYPRGQHFENFPRAGEGSEVVCPNSTTVYEMRVLQRDGTTAFREVTVNVNATQQPQISFWARETTINQGQCTRLYWDVQNVQGVWVYPQGQNWERFPRVGQDSERVCLDSTTTYEMRVLQRDNSVVNRQVTINVRAATPTPQPPVAPSDPLAGTRWNVVQFNNGQGAVTSLVADSAISLDFGTDGQVSGTSGCNSYFASYQVNNNTISIGQPGSTSMTCGEPAGVMEQEAQFRAALQSAATFRVTGNQLEIRTGGDQIALVAQRAP
ncbi:MAG: META domain-containing protein [Caldilineaceae bacterium]|nr:META domain-containing protein [Caldilineaceae bacterium]